MNQIIQIRKRGTIYLPKRLLKELGLKEGDRMIIEVEDGRIVLEPVKPPEKRGYWTTIKPEEVEEIGEEITREIFE